MKRSSSLFIIFFALNLATAMGQAVATLKSVITNDVLILPLPDSTRYTSTFLAINEKPEIIGTIALGIYDLKATAIIASTLGRGKILAFGSPAYFEKGLLANPSVRKVIQNTLSISKGTIGVFSKKNHDLVGYFKENKLYAKNLENLKLTKDIKTLFLSENIKGSTQLLVLENFVKGGGTLVIASPIETILRERTKDESNSNVFPKLNDLLAKAGIINHNMIFRASSDNKLVSIDPAPAYLHINTIPQLSLSLKYNENMQDYYTFLWFVKPTLYFSTEYNDEHSVVVKRLKDFYKIPDTFYRPTPKTPLDLSSPMKKLAYLISGNMQESQVKKKYGTKAKAIGYEDFPGKVPDAGKRIDKMLNVEVKVGTQGLVDPASIYYRPHSTGLYIPAGEVVKIVLDKKYHAQKLKAQIGIHDDDLASVADLLVRIGFDLTRVFELNQDTTKIYSPYGGLLMVNISDTTKMKTIPLKVLGAVNAPYFKLGVTDDESWNQTIKNYPAPWAELATDKIVFSVPSDRIRELKNPTALLQFYDRVMDADADLRMINRKRAHQERIIVDQQVAFGALFTSPAKIVAPNDDESTGIMLNKDLIEKKGSWGLFHELGHRHQFHDLDFNGLGEVTVNLYSMYVYDQVLNLGKYHNQDNIPNKEGVIEKIKLYMRSEPSYEKFQQNPWIALSMYIEIIEHFGWDSIKTANKSYAELPKDKYPKTNEEKIDLWFKTISQASKSDLSDFFKIWQIPVSASTIADVKEHAYSSWLPEELKEFNK
jgi:hypothetical protein